MTDDTIRPTLPTRRELLIGGALLASAGTAYVRTPRTEMKLIKPGQLDKLIPLEIGQWRYETASGLVLPPPDQMISRLYDQLVSRYYSSENGLPMMVVMAYGSSQGGMLQIHRPETCYPASGFRLSNTTVSNMPIEAGKSIPVRQFSARSDTRVEQLLYWTRIGDYLPISWAMQRVAVMKANIDGLIPDGLLVRVSTITDDAAQGQAAVRTFVRTMLDQIGPGGRRLLVGRDV